MKAVQILFSFVAICLCTCAQADEVSTRRLHLLFGVSGILEFLTAGVDQDSSMDLLLSRADDFNRRFSIDSPRERRLVLQVLCEAAEASTVPRSFDYRAASRRALRMPFSQDILTSPGCGEADAASQAADGPDSFVVVSHDVHAVQNMCSLVRLLWGLSTWHRPPRVALLLEPPIAAQTLARLVSYDAGGLGCLATRMEVFTPEDRGLNGAPHLSWAHRQLLRDAFVSDPGLKYFGFMEGDVYLDGRAAELWRRDAELLEGTSFLRQFFRLEYDSRGWSIVQRFPWKLPDSAGECRCSTKFGEKNFYGGSDFVGMWMIIRNQLDRFMQGRGKYCWDLSTWPRGHLTPRGMSAFGPYGCCDAESDPDAVCQRAMIPIDIGYQNGTDALVAVYDAGAGVWHSTNDYVHVQGSDATFGTYGTKSPPPLEYSEDGSWRLGSWPGPAGTRGRGGADPEGGGSSGGASQFGSVSSPWPHLPSIVQQLESETVFIGPVLGSISVSVAPDAGTGVWEQQAAASAGLAVAQAGADWGGASGVGGEPGPAAGTGGSGNRAEL